MQQIDITQLIATMTISEKIGQLTMLDARKITAGDIPQHKIVQHMLRHQPGFIINAYGSVAQKLTALLTAKHRLHLPPLCALDSVNGHSFHPQGTTFPTHLARSSSWNPELAYRIGQITRDEMYASGVRMTFAPVVDLARDLRWGRVSETAGEEPHLAGTLSAAFVRGLQEEDITSGCVPVAACAKHFAGYSQTQGGDDSTEACMSRQTFFADILPPFRDVIEAGCLGIMAGYHPFDGIPCSANKWLLTEVLRDELEFSGVVISDWQNLQKLVERYRVAASYEEAAAMMLSAGNDVIMGTPALEQYVVGALEKGFISEEIIDKAVFRILEVKRRLGLLSRIRSETTSAAESDTCIGCTQHKQVAYEAAIQSMVLLENKDSVLPLCRDAISRIAFIGPSIDSVIDTLGDWSLGLRGNSTWLAQGVVSGRERCSTLRDGLQEFADKHDISLTTAVLDDKHESYQCALASTADADVVLVQVGDSRDDIGERTAQATLEIPSYQREFLTTLSQRVEVPCIVLYQASKPYCISWIRDYANALLVLWNGGQQSGTVTADVLFGEREPEGRLSLSFPWHVGQLPVRYNKRQGSHTKTPHYTDLPEETSIPLYTFGQGCGYSSFRIESAELLPYSIDETGLSLSVTVTIKNTGARIGSEVIQVYVEDSVASVTKAAYDLCGYQKVTLSPGEQKTVVISIASTALMTTDSLGRRAIEAGIFTFYAGTSARSRDLISVGDLDLSESIVR